MKKNKLTVIFFLAILFAGVNIHAQKSVQLRYNLTQGDMYSLDMKIDQDIVFQANGQTMTLDQVMDFYTSSEVTNTKDSIVIKNTINRLIMDQSIMGMQVKYDSDQTSDKQNPMSAAIAEQMGKIINKSYTITMDNMGNVKNTDVSELVGGDDLVSNFSSGANIAVYPENSVGVGDSWETDIEPIESSDMKFHAKYTVLKLSGDQATLQIDGVISANKMKDVEGDINLKGLTKGEVVIDTKTGWMVESKMEQEIKLDIEQNGTKFPATIAGYITAASKKK